MGIIPEPDRKPIEQFGMGRSSSHLSEIAWSITYAAAEVVVPNPIDDAAPGERVIAVRQPIGERGPTGRLTIGVTQHKSRRQHPYRGEGARPHYLHRFIDVATIQPMNGLRLR